MWGGGAGNVWVVWVCGCAVFGQFVLVERLKDQPTKRMNNLSAICWWSKYSSTCTQKSFNMYDRQEKRTQITVPLVLSGAVYVAVAVPVHVIKMTKQVKKCFLEYPH